MALHISVNRLVSIRYMTGLSLITSRYSPNSSFIRSLGNTLRSSRAQGRSLPFEARTVINMDTVEVIPTRAPVHDHAASRLSPLSTKKSAIKEGSTIPTRVPVILRIEAYERRSVLS